MTTPSFRIHRAVLTVFVLLIPTAAAAATIDVTIGPGISFNPSNVTIALGDIVRWTWTGGLPHSTTSNSNASAEAWNSGVLTTGTFSHTFTNAGTWPYYCSVHSFPGGTAMNGIVQVVAPAPTLTSVSPTGGTTAGGTGVTLRGTNFVTGCSASFGGSPGTSTTVSNATTITTLSPAHAAGTVAVSVTCPGGTATLNNAYTFAPPPAITDVQPRSAPPTAQVTITGSGFQNGASVTFGGMPSGSVSFVDSATLRAIVPDVAAGPVTIVVTNPDSQAATFVGFVSLGASAIPALTSVTLLILAIVLALAGAVALGGRW